MTVGHAQPEGNPRFVSMEQFAADVAEATNGHVKIEVYGNGQLGTEKEMLEQVVAGTVIINLCDAGGYRQFSNSKHAIKAPADLKGLKTGVADGQENPWVNVEGMPIIEIFKGAAPYVICNVIVLISISLWGPLTTALPQLLGYSIF